MAHKYVYLFSEGNATMRNLLGGKGANLAEMTNIGLPVPQGFTISTEACTQYYEEIAILFCHSVYFLQNMIFSFLAEHKERITPPTKNASERS